jgi:hypothetical protein
MEQRKGLIAEIVRRMGFGGWSDGLARPKEIMMRKIFLIMAFALMSTSSCYANLSLADASQAPGAEPAVLHSSITPSKQSSESHRHVAKREARSASAPRRSAVWAVSSYGSQFSDHCH